MSNRLPVPAVVHPQQVRGRQLQDHRQRQPLRRPIRLLQAPVSPGQADRRHRLVASGIVQLPCGILTSVIADFRSSLPMNPVSSIDLNTDGYANDLPAGVEPFSGCRDLDLAAVNTFRQSRGAGCGVPRSSCPGFANVDVRLSKTFQLGSRSRSSSSGSCSTSPTARTTTCRATTSPRPRSASRRRCCRTSTRPRVRRSSPSAIASRKYAGRISNSWERAARPAPAPGAGVPGVNHPTRADSRLHVGVAVAGRTPAGGERRTAAQMRWCDVRGHLAGSGDLCAGQLVSTIDEGQAYDSHRVFATSPSDRRRRPRRGTRRFGRWGTRADGSRTAGA